MIKKLILGAVACTSLTAGMAYAAPSNLPPPSGAILDLAGQPITNSNQTYSTSFVAGVASTAITFAFRQDPSFESFTDVSVIDTTTSSGNLILNGNFASGSGSSATNWLYANIYGATFGGVVATAPTCTTTTATCWYDGAVQAYDAISQTIATTPNDVYQISFTLNGGGGGSGFYQDLSTNGNVTGTGGNGIDVLAYAQAGLPPAGTVPEPATWAMMLIGMGVTGYALRKHAIRSQSVRIALS